MRRQITLSVALVVSLVSIPLMISDITEAQRGRRRQRNLNQQPQGDTAQQNSGDQSETPRQARRGRWRQRQGGQQKPADGTTGTTGTTGESVTVVRRVSQVQLSAAAIKTINASDESRRFVEVRGMTIAPRANSSIWLLSNGSHVVVGGGTAEPYAAEFVPQQGKVFNCDGCVIWEACYCPEQLILSPVIDDGCGFDGPAKKSTCKQRGENCTCEYRSWIVYPDGTTR